MDPARGQQYREKILLPGGSRDEIDSLTVSCVSLNIAKHYLIRSYVGLPRAPAELCGFCQGLIRLKDMDGRLY